MRPVDRKTRGPHSSLLSAISHQLRRPPLKIASFVLGVSIATLSVWAVWSWISRPTGQSSQCMEAMRNGTNALRDGTYDRAMKAFDGATNLCGDYPLARARLAETLTELEYTDRAQKELLRTHQPDANDTSREALSLQAIRMTLMGDPRGATAIYEKIAQQSKEGVERAAAYVDLGRAQERDGYPTKAVESYKKALESDPQQTAAAMRLGVILGRRQGAGTEGALSHFNIAEARFASANDAEGLGEVSYQRGVVYTTRRESGKAQEHLRRAIANAGAIGNKYLEIKSRLQLSNVFSLEGNAAAAQGYASEALDFARANNLEVLTINGLATLGNSFITRDLGQAERYYQRALELADFYQTRRSRVRVLLSLASLESQRHSRPANIRAYVDRALPITKEDGYRKFEIQAQELIGHAYLQQGDYGLARLAFERQLELAREYDDPDQLSRGYEGHGITMRANEDYPAALADFERNLEMAQKVGLKPNIATALANRADVFWRLGRYADAKQSLADSEQTAASAELEGELLARVKLIAAQAALSFGEYRLAETEARLALQRAGEQFEAVAIEARSTVCLAQAFTGNAREGVKTCAEALEIAQRLGTPPLISNALLALATAKLEAGDTQGALADATTVRETFRRAGQQESEWRALSIAALASMRGGHHGSAQSYRSEAEKVLAGFAERFDAATYQRYINRGDVQRNHHRLVNEVATLTQSSK